MASLPLPRLRGLRQAGSAQGDLVATLHPTMPARPIPGFRPVPFTGVIYVMAEAARRGFRLGHPEWCNLGQGMPETGPLPGAPPRVQQVPIAPDDQEYAPVPGIWELRRADTASRERSCAGRSPGEGSPLCCSLTRATPRAG